MSPESFPPLSILLVLIGSTPRLMIKALTMLMRIMYSRCWYVRPLIIACAICTMVSVLRAQTANQFPSPTNHVNDFAGVIETPVKNHLETLLTGLKEKTKIDFYVATVDATGGQDIADFSRQLATDWKIGARTSTTKSLLLVVAVASKS